MITTAELRAIPFFAKLGDHELDYLARTCADIHLTPGEYAVHEGEPGALIVVIEGVLEITKLSDDVEVVVRVRKRGDLFGEVSIALQTSFIASLRAKDEARVIRIEPREFYALAAMAPEIAKTVGADALRLLQELQESFAQPGQPELLIIGSRWDAACHSLRSFLYRNRVAYEWLTPDDPAVSELDFDREAAAKCPYVRLRDGTMLWNPSVRDVAKAIGLTIAPARREYDVVIVGGGPAGLAAAVYGSSEGLSTVLIDRDAPGGQAGTSSRIENYLGFPVGVSGDELAHRALVQAKRFGAEIVVTRNVEKIDTLSRTVTLDGGDTISSKAVILALGVAWRRLGVESIDRLTGRGVYYGAARSEAGLTQGQDIYLIGGGNSAGQAAIFFASHARNVTLLVRGESLSATMSYYLIEELKSKSNVTVLLRSEVTAGYGDEHLEAIDILSHSSGETSRHETRALFVLIGADADTKWLSDDIARDDKGYVLSGSDVLRLGKWSLERDPFLVETSVPGIFAAGDVRSGSVKRVASGVGEGSIAIAFVHQYINAQ
jgi:thioredoxin reductase (NADPH)